MDGARIIAPSGAREVELLQLLIPLGFGLLALQVLSEVGKRLAVLVRGEAS